MRVLRPVVHRSAAAALHAGTESLAPHRPLPCTLPAGVSPTAAFLVDHTTRSYYDLYRERKAHLRPIDQEASC